MCGPDCPHQISQSADSPTTLGKNVLMSYDSAQNNPYQQNQPQHQPSAGWAPASQPSASAPNTQFSNIQDPQPQWQTPSSALAKQGKDGLRALFDFSFEHYVTPSVAKIAYVLGIVLGVLGYSAGVIAVFVITSQLGAAGGILGLFCIVLFLVPLLVYIVVLRMATETVLAQIRTAQYTRELANK